MTQAAAARAADRAARSSYGRLLALLVARTRDMAAAEDALSEAFVTALQSWNTQGIPDNPDAWLLTVARNRLHNRRRHQRVIDGAANDLALLIDELAPESETLPDERLKLLFVCAHPAIDAAIRTPLMLQAVLGLDAANIARAFLMAPATMGQRLVRAKAKIRDAGLRFELPTTDDMPARLTDVLEAIYAAFGVSWDIVAGAEEAARDLTDEAIYLARLLVSLLPDQPEARGLLALMLYCQARRPARRDHEGRFVPLAKQDVTRWSRDMIIEAEDLLTSAARSGRFGRFQCEAAIQSVHAQAAITNRKQHAALDTLYQLLAMHCPSVGGMVSWAAAQLDAGRFNDALTTLDTLNAAEIERYQPYWVTRSQVLRALGQSSAATQALQHAIELTTDVAVREYLHTL